MKRECIFCSEFFPLDYQIIYEFKFWYFIYEINPMRDFHCMLISKEHYWGIEEVDDLEILQDIWRAIKVCVDTMKRSSKNIKSISILSLNLWKCTKHLHFHLIPIFYTDNIKNINNYIEDWSWINFLANKEVVQDSYQNYIKSIFWNKSDILLKKINNILRKTIKENVLILKNNLSIDVM